MYLKSLTLKNIRSYTNQIITFQEGSTLLSGDIGSGKTTILIAIEFALFGLLKGDINGTTLLRHGSNEGTVTLELDIEKNTITIFRKLKRNKNTINQDAGYMIINGNRFDGTPIELRAKMLELLGYPEEFITKNPGLLYRYTIYTPQEEMKQILFESTEMRLDILRKIFDIDKYKRINENAVFYAKELRTMKKILEGKIQDVDEQQTQCANNKEQLRQLNEKQTKIIATLQEYTKQSDNHIQMLRTFEEKINAITLLRREIELALFKSKSKTQELDDQKRELNIVEYRLKEFHDKLQELQLQDINEEDVRKELQTAEETLTKITSAREIINERITQRTKELAGLIIEDKNTIEQQITILREEIAKKQEQQEEQKTQQQQQEKILLEIHTLKITKKNAEQTVAQLDNLSTCPTCFQNVDFSHKVKITDKEKATILETTRKLEDATKKQQLVQEALKQTTEILNAIEKKEREVDLLAQKQAIIQEYSRRKEELTLELAELQSKKEKLDAMDINKLIDKISLQRKILNTVAVQKHIIESLKEKQLRKEELDQKIQINQVFINTTKQEIAEKEVQINAHAEIESAYLTAKKESDVTATKIKEYEILDITTKKDIDNITQEIKKLEETIAKKLLIKEKITAMNNTNQWITEHFVNIISTIEKAILQRIYHEFNELFKKWFSILLEDETIEVMIDDTFTPLIIQNNYDTPMENLSGGEKTAVALAYRLALNKVINDFITTIKTRDCIILDEPTDGFSTEQLDKMREVLDELHMRQVIIVSHEAKLESYVQNTIRIVKNEHQSHVQGS